MEQMSGMGSRIRQARGATRQAVFAEQIGASVRSLQYWESGRVEPRASQIRRIAAATGRPFEFFLDSDEEDEADLHRVLSRIVARQVARAIGGAAHAWDGTERRRIKTTPATAASVRAS